jgi:hypothetical protein
MATGGEVERHIRLAAILCAAREDARRLREEIVIVDTLSHLGAARFEFPTEQSRCRQHAVRAGIS